MSTFAVAQANRAGRVYAAANDGMLHAFDGTTGNEAWSYIPGIVVPQLYKLADAAYATNHQFYVDGQLVAGDAYDGTNWRTVLVGGLGRGGKGYYALDITDPASPKALWEFGTAQDPNIGYSYGNPLLTKRQSDAKWVVLVTSGYNNSTTSPADGRARLYVLDAFTGAKLAEYYTNTSTDSNTNGLGKIANWVDETLLDNTTQYVYGGDLGGNLWRFDLTAASGTSAVRLGFTSATPGDQPITMRPELGRVKGPAGVPYRAVFFGTGRYLGFTDLTPGAPSQSIAQAIYAVKDTGADLGLLKASAASLVAQTLHSGTSPRTMAPPVPVNWTTQNGWYLTIPVGERMTIDPTLQLSTLAVASNVPEYQLLHRRRHELAVSAQLLDRRRGIHGTVQQHRCGHQHRTDGWSVHRQRAGRRRQRGAAARWQGGCHRHDVGYQGDHRVAADRAVRHSGAARGMARAELSPATAHRRLAVVSNRARRAVSRRGHVPAPRAARSSASAAATAPSPARRASAAGRTPMAPSRAQWTYTCVSRRCATSG